MRVGLLLCDHVRPEFGSIAGDYPDFFARFLPGQEWEVFDLSAGEFPGTLGSCDAWLTSGSRHSVYEAVDWIENFVGLIRQLHQEQRRLLGICFGAQMMAHALGGRVERAPVGWQVGIKEAEFSDGRRLRIIHSNADQITDLAPEMVRLATSDTNPNEVVAVGDHFLGLQGHPEFTADYAAGLMEARRGSLIPEDVVEAGLASLVDPPDTAAWRVLALDFLTRPS